MSCQAIEPSSRLLVSRWTTESSTVEPSCHRAVSCRSVQPKNHRNFEPPTGEPSSRGDVKLSNLRAVNRQAVSCRCFPNKNDTLIRLGLGLEGHWLPFEIDHRTNSTLITLHLPPPRLKLLPQNQFLPDLDRSNGNIYLQLLTNV
jgi:hypothetical protein